MQEDDGILRNATPQDFDYYSDTSDSIPSPTYSQITNPDSDDGNALSDFSSTEDMFDEIPSDVEESEAVEKSDCVVEPSLPSTASFSVPTSSFTSPSCPQSDQVEGDSGSFRPPLSIPEPTADLPDGFVIGCDNIDKNVRPSNQRSDRRTQSWHCFHSYCASNRIKTSTFSCASPSAIVSPSSVLPNQEDLKKILNDFETLSSRLAFKRCGMLLTLI